MKKEVYKETIYVYEYKELMDKLALKGELYGIYDDFDKIKLKVREKL